MLCPLCRTRKARRHCPAVGHTICSVCCGTKRLAEIACPADCVYLATAREHPAAVVRRQQERDLAALLPTLQGLGERQYQLFFLFQTLIARHKPEGFVRLRDDDVADAATAMAATLETAAKGVIYDHGTQSLPAGRLVTEMKALLAEIREKGATVHDREAATVLRAIAQGARDARHVSEGGDVAYLLLMGRLLQQGGRAAAPAEADEGRGASLILP